jgi:hypothetical protein
MALSHTDPLPAGADHCTPVFWIGEHQTDEDIVGLTRVYVVLWGREVGVHYDQYVHEASTDSIYWLTMRQVPCASSVQRLRRSTLVWQIHGERHSEVAYLLQEQSQSWTRCPRRSSYYRDHPSCAASSDTADCCASRELVAHHVQDQQCLCF